jgi:hypothetical protein
MPSKATLGTCAVWLLAFALAAGIGHHQRKTGPTYPVRGEIEIGGAERAYRLVRSGTSGEDAVVSVPATDDGGEIHYRRYEAGDEFTTVPLRRQGDELVANLPTQPPAGKLEYFVTLGARRLPVEGTAVLRFKDAVPIWVLLPHIVVIFLAFMFGFRTAFAAVGNSPRLARLVAWTVGLMTLGGMILGPIVQKFAFGEFWTGWPRGQDLTDNKMLLLWAAWLVAGSVVLITRRSRPAAARILIVAATVVMVGVFLIPHSLRGSQLNYRKLDEGVTAEEAIETGR